MKSLLLLAFLVYDASGFFNFGVPAYQSLNRWDKQDNWAYYPMKTVRPYPPLFPLALEFLNEASRFTKAEIEDRKDVLDQYDFVIVGAGTAGCIVANRLTENSTWKVLLIEAGDSENYVMGIPMIAQFLKLSHVNWKYKSLPSHNTFKGMINGQTPLAQGKVMGGGSTITYGIYARGHSSDYDNWEAMGNPGWNWNNLLPYFKKSEDFMVPWARNDAPFEEEYHSLEGYQGVSGVEARTPLGQAYLDAGEEMGIPQVDYNGKNMIGISPIQATTKGGMKMSTNNAFLHPIKHRQNLHVIKKSHVTKLLIDETKTVTGVEYIRNGIKCRVGATKEVILSAGAIGSPHILMHSGIGPKNNLKSVGIKLIKKLPVGFNLMDHPVVAAVTVMINQSLDYNERSFTSNPYITEAFLRNREGVYSIPSGVEAIGLINTDSPKDVTSKPNLELKFTSGTLSTHKALYVTHGIKRSVFDKIHEKLYDKHGFTICVSTLNSLNKGRVFLNSSNPLEQPYVYTDYLEDPNDVDKLLKGIEFVKTMLETEPMRKLDAKLHESLVPQCECFKNNSTEYWKCHIKQLVVSNYNLCGTCKMGDKSDKTSVVDHRLKVHGISKLRVIDSSVFPLIPSSSIIAATMMVAEKGSDVVKEDYMDVPFDSVRK